MKLSKAKKSWAAKDEENEEAKDSAVKRELTRVPQVRLNIEIPKSLHHQLKTAALAKDTTLRDYVLPYLEQAAKCEQSDM